MKKAAIVTLIMIAIAGTALAEEEMLFHGRVTHGAFGAPALKYTQFKGKSGILCGGRFGWIINNCFIIGGGGYGLANENIDNREIAPGHTQFLSLGYGGLEMEYIFLTHKLIHPSLGILIGGGSINYPEKNIGGVDERENDFDGFFILEPSASIELNIMSFWRADLGVSYRLVSGVDSFGLTDSDIGGPAASLTFKFGKFWP